MKITAAELAQSLPARISITIGYDGSQFPEQTRTSQPATVTSWRKALHGSRRIVLTTELGEMFIAPNAKVTLAS